MEGIRKDYGSYRWVGGASVSFLVSLLHAFIPTVAILHGRFWDEGIYSCGALNVDYMVVSSFAP